VYGKFVDFRRHGVYAAHNRHAENGFLKSTWALPPAVPDWRNGSGTAQEWGPWIDTLTLYRALYPGLEGYGLGELVDRFGLRHELQSVADKHCPPNRCKPHCALFDALASALLLLRLERESALANRLTLGWLLQISEGRAPQQELF
jgi:DNA polymerase-3 subunit epsilon